MANDNQTIFQILVDVIGQEAVDKLSAAVSTAGESGSKASPELQDFVARLQDLADRSQLVAGALDLQKQVEANSVAFANAKQALADLNAEFSRSDKSSADISAAFAQAQKQVNSLASEQLNLQNQSVAMSDKLRAAGIDSTKLGETQADLRNETKGVADEMLRAASSASESANRFSAVKEAAARAAESLKSGAENALEFGKKLLEITGIAGLVASALATITGFRFFETAVEEARSGEQALARLKAAVDGNSEAFDNLKEAAEKAAESVGTTSNDAVNTATKLVSLLGSYGAAASALPPTLTLAKAATIDFGEAADIVSAILRSFGLQASEAGRVADSLAAIAARTGVNLSELARGAAQLAPLAKEAGIGFDTVAAALAELSSKGFDAQKSNAGLREMFIALSTPTSKLRQDLVGLGIDTTSLGTILDGLRNAGDRGRQALQDLQVKGRAAVSALVQGGSADLQRFQAVLDSSSGAASRTAKLLSDTLDGQLKAFGRTVDSLAEDAVKGALPAVEAEVKKLNDELKDVGKSETFSKLKDAIRDFVKGAVDAFDEFVHKGIDWKDLAKQIADFATSAKDSMASFASSVKGIGGVFTDLTNGVTVAFNAVMLVLDNIGLGIKSTLYYFTAWMANAFEAIAPFSDAAAEMAVKLREIQKQYADDYKVLSDEIAQRSEKLKTALKALETSTTDAGNAAQAAALKQQAHSKALDDALSAATGAARAMVGLPPSIRDTAKSAEDAGPKIRGLADDLHIVRDATGPVLTQSAKVETAFHNLKISSQEELKEAAKEAKEDFDLIDKSSADTAAGLADRQNAFLVYAKKALEASAQLDQGKKDSTQYELESKAAALGVLDALLKLEGEGVKANNSIAVSASGAAQQMSEAARAAERYKEALDKLRGGNGTMEDLTVATKNASTATEAQAAAAEGAEVKMRSEMGAAQSLGQVMANTAAEFRAVSDAAGNEFNEAMDRALFNIGLTKVATTDLTKSLGDLNSAASDDTSGFVSYFRALAAVQAQVQEKIDGQRQSLANQIGQLNQLGAAGQTNFGLMGDSAAKVLTRLQAMKSAIADGNSGFDVLGKQELQPLQQALDSAIQRVHTLNDQAAAAEKTFQDLVKSTRDALLQEQGNQAALEDERHQQQLADLKAAAEAANQLNSQIYQQAVQRENELHALKMKNIQDQAAAANKANAGASSSTSSGASASSNAEPTSSSGVGAAPPSGPITNSTYNMQFYGFGAGNSQDFVRQIKIELDRIAARSR